MNEALTPIVRPQDLQPWEEKWWENLPDVLKRVVCEHGKEVFHFVINHAMVQEELNAMAQRIKARDAQMHLQRIAGGFNIFTKLLEGPLGVTVEKYAACKRDIETAISLGAAGPKIIVPDGALRH